MDQQEQAKNIEAIYPLSPMQQGMLFHGLLAPEAGAYVTQWLCMLPLTVPAFIRAWQEVVSRHEVLRTAFIWEGVDEPLQIVGRQVELCWQEIDWREYSEAEQQDLLRSWLEADRQRGFEFSTAPLMRFTFIQLDSECYQFIWSFHHLLLDGWSVPLVLKDVFAFYQGKQVPQRQSRAYEDYIAWLQRQDLDRAETFWRQALQGFTPPTLLPGNQKPDVQKGQEDTRYAEQEICCSPDTTAALQSVARRHHLTLNTLIQGAWALLLSRYSGEADVVFGSVVSGRPVGLAGSDAMVGMFINTIPVRVQIPSGAFLIPWLKQLQDWYSEAREYEHSPLPMVQKWSGLPADRPIFESILVFQNYPVVSLEGGDENPKQPRARTIDQTNYPLTVVVVPGTTLLIRISYGCSRFSAAVVTRLLEHFRELLKNIVLHPDRRIAEISIMGHDEERQIVKQWNATEMAYPQDRCLHQFFEEQVRCTPQACALVFEDEQLSYQQLYQRANQLAHFLQRRGVGPEVPVGLCLPRSSRLLIALLAILTAGGVYVPLDHSYPTDRLAWLIQDSGVRLVLSQRTLSGLLPSGCDVIYLDDEDWTAYPPTAPLSQVSPDNLAYILYTSGSTGRPKGVMVPHRGLTNYLYWARQAYAVTEGEGAPVHTSLSFDLTVTSLLLPLIAGRTVVLLGEERGVEALDRALHSSHLFSLIKLTPAHLMLLNEQRSSSQSVQSRRLIIGGEALTVASVLPWIEAAPQTRLVNEYGPTETVVGCCVYEIPEAWEERSGSVAIGRPIANTQLYVLDAQGRLPVPVGVIGEIFIGGVGVTRGYQGRADLTAERFVPDPFRGEAGARLYRTGDLGRWRADGVLEFVGRRDQQIKLRGYRIELGEIEGVLREHPRVREVAVIMREDHVGDRRLVAYVVGAREGEPQLTAEELRPFLQSRLPDFMIPAAIVLLERLPLTSNGKVDKHALPAPERGKGTPGEGYAPPDTPLEKTLAGIWADVLGVERVGVYDNFFELGGHSLLAIQVLSRVRETCQVNLPLRNLFEAATVAEMARSIEAFQLAEQGEAAKISAMLEKVAQLSDDEVRYLLTR